VGEFAEDDSVAEELAPSSTLPARCMRPEGMHLLAADRGTRDWSCKGFALPLTDGVFRSTLSPDCIEFVLQEAASLMILGLGDVCLDANAVFVVA
jgi:hypothetical protein